ncbi:MAG TPA: hypothetical protein VGN44_14760 [Candidatus Angelobacter sp.]|jgi:hypothetical protein
MPKSFKVCPVRKFQTTAFSEKPVCLNQQPPLAEMTEVPTTKIHTSLSRPGFEDFIQYVIEHDRIVKMPGRFGSIIFPEFTYTGIISGFFGQKRDLLLLSGKKADVLSFCTTSTRVAEVQIDTLQVEMNALQAALPSVNLVWFKFRAGMIRASALMGANVEKTEAFVQSKSEGEISTLSFYFEDSSAEKHPVMIVDDGTIVLQATYPDTSGELELVTSIYEKLLLPVSIRISPKMVGKRFSVIQTPS